MEEVRIVLPFPSVFYATIYIAHARDLFRSNGIQAELTFVGNRQDPVQGLANAEAAIGGPVRLMRYSPNEASKYVIIGQVNSASGFFIVGRGKYPFAWNDLAGRRFIPFPNSDTPWLFTRSTLRAHKVDPNDVQLVKTRTVETSIRAFREGLADFIEVPEPYLSSLLATEEKLFHISMATTLGTIPFSVLIARRDMAREKRFMFVRFLQSVRDSQAWVGKATAEEVADELKKAFPDVPLAFLKRSADRYKREGVWATSPTIEKDAFVALQTIIGDGAERLNSLTYEQTVDNLVTA